jgi:hypothetical protein
LVKEERGNELGDFHKISNKWKNYFSQLPKVHRASGVRQTETNTAEPFLPQYRASDFEVVVGKLKS